MKPSLNYPLTGLTERQVELIKETYHYYNPLIESAPNYEEASALFEQRDIVLKSIYENKISYDHIKTTSPRS